MAQYGVWNFGTDQYGLGNSAEEADAVGSSTLSHQCNISTIYTHVVAQSNILARNTFNQFDEHGFLVGLQRLRSEKNWEYKRRILDAFVNKANSTYRGLINGITRELGLSLFYPISINPKRNEISKEFYAPDPYIKFDGVWLYLYSDYTNDVLDFQIDRFQPGGNYEILSRLVDLINTTVYFEASFLPNIDPITRSMTIINQSNRTSIINEAVPASTKFKLAHEYIVAGSISTNKASIFRKEVDSTNDVDANGKYYVDYINGIITAYEIPDIDTTISYQYTQYSFRPVASPIILYDINNDNFKTKMFEQVELADDSLVHGLPTELGVDIVNELLSVHPLYYGI